ncbi:unnamed protein product [marine sediment metagenome]|uniref:Uncharacterized protein n=1 Tax=marine sediment metagenome TaxID=412755 RepID=X0S0D5_9ZZZZ
MDPGQNSVEEEITSQDPVSTVVDENNPEESQGDPQGQEGDPQDRNWKELRKKTDEAEKEAREANEKLNLQKQFIESLLAQNQQQQQQTPPPKEEVDELVHISPEEYLTVEQSDKRSRTIARDEFNRLEVDRKAKEAKVLEGQFKKRLKAEYSDFDDIVNSETIAILEQKEPELATTIADLKDPYKMGLQTYKFIKSLNIAGSSDGRRHAKEVVDKIDKNEKTVQSPQAFNKRPMAKAFSVDDMTEEQKKSLYEETLMYARRSPGY